MIMQHLESAVEMVRGMGYVPVYAALYGSQNYGMDVYCENHQADYDVKVIVMPSIHDVVFKRMTVSRTVEYDGGVIDIKDVLSMSENICKANPQYLEILLTPFYLTFPGGEYLETIRSRTQDLLSSRRGEFARAVFGCFHGKLKDAFRVKPSTQDNITKFGYDGKSLHHALRFKLMLEDFEKTGRMVLHPPSEHTTFLINLKLNEIPLDRIFPLVDLWGTEAEQCANRIIQTASPVSESCADEIMSETRRALYFALKSDLMGSNPIYTKEYKNE